jgi:hypothetical protein
MRIEVEYNALLLLSQGSLFLQIHLHCSTIKASRYLDVSPVESEVFTTAGKCLYGPVAETMWHSLEP